MECLGLLLYKLKKFQDAIHCYDKAIQIDPEFSDAFYHKGISKLKSLGLTLKKL